MYAFILHALRHEVNKTSSINHPREKDRVSRTAYLSVIFSISCLLNLLPYSRSTNEIFALLGCHAAWIGSLQMSYP